MHHHRLNNSLEDNGSTTHTCFTVSCVSPMNERTGLLLVASLASQMLVHFPFGGIICSVIEKGIESCRVPMAPFHELFQYIIGSFQNILWGKVRLQNLTVACFLTSLSDERPGLIVELIVTMFKDSVVWFWCQLLKTACCSWICLRSTWLDLISTKWFDNLGRNAVDFLQSVCLL